MKDLVVLFLLVAMMSLGCEHKLSAPEPPALIPEVTAAQIQPNPNNVLSVIVNLRARNAATIAVEYGPDSLLHSSTPVFSVSQEDIQIPVLGLPGNTALVARVVATSATGHRAKSDLLTFTTPAPPSDLPALSVLTNHSPHPGLVMMGFTASSNNSANCYALIVDNQGRTIWYRQFREPVLDFQKQLNGNYTVLSSLNGAPLHFYELDRLGNVLREFSASEGRMTGVHELRLSEGSYALYGVEYRTVDLTALGGRADAAVRGNVIEYHRMNHMPFFWSTLERLEVSEATPDINMQSAEVNPWHCNAIDFDHDGHLLVSFRNSDMIVKIDAQTGAIIWRLGGKKNQFVFFNDPFNGFSHQHGIRRLANGHIILFDNGNLHAPPVSRAVEYELNESAKTATLVWEYRHEPPLFGSALGFAQRLPNGNTLINYGLAQRVIEVDQAGTKVWEVKVEELNRFVYRAFRIDSLY
ncbi:MAG: aryl-sulfate sulfotransferase [bacterium]